MPFLNEIARIIAASPLNELALYLLRNVPGLPPIMQAIHIVSIAAVIASAVFVALRALGLALPSQNLREMTRRLMPWTWWAVLVLAASGSILILARPYRYFSNPVFGWKMGFLAGALLLTFVMVRQIKRDFSVSAPSSATTVPLKLLAAAVLALWILVVLAGRWIAYAEYLFAPAY